ncbi:MAG: hypothetical protein ACREM8_02360 [Vulcanimicrobiaceae bacterium]
MHGAQTELRPLGFGEMLDRAISLGVRRFVPLAVLLAVYVVPANALMLRFQLSAQRLSTTAQPRTGPVGAADPAAMHRLLLDSQSVFATLGWVLGLAAIVYPLVLAVAGMVVWRSNVGESPGIAGAVRAGLAVWPRLIGIAVLYALCGLAALIVLAIAVFVIATAAGFVLVAAHATIAFAIFAIALGIALGCGFLLFGGLVTLAFAISTFTCVVEHIGARAAVGIGLRRVFARSALRRSVLGGLVLFALSVGEILIAAAGGSVVGFAHNVVAVAAFGIAIGIIFGVVRATFLAIYYIDERLRFEGLDLQLAAGAIAPQPN